MVAASAFKGGGGVTAAGLWKDPVERAKHTLCADMPRRWEHVWGEKYEEVWHKEVKGYHFFGRHWHEDEYKHAGEKPFADYILSKADQFSLRGTKPFFILSHRRHHAAFCQALKDFPNAIALFGHWHWSNADWKTIFFDADTFGGRFPNIQVGACRMDGGNAVTPSSEVKLPEDSSSWKGDNLPSRQAMIINIYDDMVVFERHEVGKGGKLGPDWVECKGPKGKLKSLGEFNAVEIPDAAMTLAVLALFADGPMTITGIASWRVKETDRIAAMAAELRKVGAEVRESMDSITVTPPQALQGASIETYNDHRMAMCFSLVSLGGVPIKILDPACVNKTYPSFFEDFKRFAK